MSGWTDEDEMRVVNYLMHEKKPDIELSKQFLEFKPSFQQLEEKFPEKVKAIRDAIAAI